MYSSLYDLKKETFYSYDSKFKIRYSREGASGLIHGSNSEIEYMSEMVPESSKSLVAEWHLKSRVI
jgi:hypothetical protein